MSLIIWIIAIVIILIIVFLIINKAQKNYNVIRISGGKIGGIKGFISACCGKRR